MSAFATKIINWQKREGRHDLPWQKTRDPYRIWLSEIMLQQTQVAAVIPYYERFLARFPDIASLAAASLDEVMPFWAGLGYYARARNLHRGAQQIMADDAGVFPKEFEAIHALSGVGRSTAAAISAFAFGQRRAILDGNVKRVFARHFCIEGDVRSSAVEERMWLLAEEILPRKEIEAYTQGLMDLGATLCRRSRPSCLLCPLQKSCAALSQSRVEELPAKSARRSVPHRQLRMLVVIASGEVLLERRPPTGVWGGLWSLPEMPVDADILQTLQTRYGIAARTVRELSTVEHGFTHFSLSIYPVRIVPVKMPRRAMEPGLVWLGLDDAIDAAVPAPVKRIIESVRSTQSIRR